VEKNSGMEYWITRHSKSGKGVESSPDLSEKGVEMARERAKTIAEFIKKARKGSVIFYGGVTSAPKTRSTMELYTDEVEKILTEENVRFIRKEDIKEQADQSGYLRTANEISSKINEMPDQKVVIELPLFLKELSMERYLYEKDRKTVKPEWQRLLDKHGKNYSEAIKDWFNDLELAKSINPQEIAKNCMDGMQRLADFSKRFFPNRPVKIGFVGHSFFIDALLVYIANERKVSTEGFEKIGGEVLKETELSVIEFDGEGRLQLQYRDKIFSLPI
jgi:hypothetical protein